jgi:hypothetical protein
MGFPEDADTGLKAEILVGEWTDITSDTRTDQTVTITRGRSDYASQADPTKAVAKVNNPDGRYSRENPLGPYFGLLGRNTPLRLSVAAGSPWLALDGTTDNLAVTPAVDALNITGDIDIRTEAALDWRNPDEAQGIVGRWGNGADIWLLWVYQGRIRLNWFDSTGGLWTVQGAVPDALSERAAIRATFDADNGAGGITATLYWSDTIAGPWTQFSTTTATGTQTLTTNSTPLTIAPDDNTGLTHATGKLYAVQVRDGIDGTLVVNADFTAQPVGATAFTDTTGLDWTVATGGITNRSTRTVVEVPSWPARWGPSGQLVTATLNGAGILRRLRQGASALDSTLRRRVASADHLLGYWPMEDGQDSTQAASGLPGGRPATATGLTWASDSSLGGSSALPVVDDDGALLTATTAATTATGWHVECVYKLPTLPASLTAILRVRITGAAIHEAVVSASTSAIRIEAFDSTGASLAHFDFTTAKAIADFAGQWNRLIVTVADDGGGTCRVIAAWPSIADSTWWAAMTTCTSGLGRVPSVVGPWSPALTGLAIGHLAVFDVHATWDGTTLTFGTTIYDNADSGFDGESVAQRVSRLCTEEGVPLSTPYGVAAPDRMGPQRANTLLNLLQEAADADVGVLYELRDDVALGYRTRASLYNQTPRLVLDHAAQQVAPPLEPEDDDQQTRNDITVSRPSGSSAPAVLKDGPLSVQSPPDGVGRYTDSRTINVETDEQLPDLAGWLLHLGTYDGVRYPQVTIFLHRSPELIDAARELDLGDRIQIINLPAWQPPDGADLIVQGIREVIGVHTWTMTFTCTPAGPWTVGVLEDEVLGRCDTDGSELAAGIDADDTTLSIAVTDGPLWTTDTGEYPMDLRIGGGEVVTVTACSGTSSPQTMTVTRATNGISRAWDAGTDVRLATPMVLAL